MLGLWRTRDTEFRIKVKLRLYRYDEDLGEDGKPYRVVIGAQVTR